MFSFVFRERSGGLSTVYPCCTFRAARGSGRQYGRQIWKTYTVPERPTRGKTSKGVTIWAPNGASLEFAHG